MILPSLHIRLKRHSDGSASITLTRADGTVTWQRQKGSLALVFPAHDLTHCAVEQTLGYNGAFYGLVADGWDIPDFAVPYPRGPVPLEAREVEMLVGLFDGIRPDRAKWGPEEFNAEMTRLAADSRFGGGSMVPRRLTAEQIAEVRRVRDDLLKQWERTGAGEALEVEFRRGGVGVH